MRAFAVFLCGLSFLCQSVRSQDVKAETEGKPVAALDETAFDFGLINEESGFATHVFHVGNVGNAPLVITHVQSSCGCTEPQWTNAPIAPGKKGEVIITYDPTNRPGPFKKNVMIYTNDKEQRLRVSITGDVVPKSANLQRSFHDTIGTVQMERKEFVFYTVRPGAVIKQELWMQNFADEDLTLSFENIPDFIRVEAPEQLKSGKAERFRITLDASGLADKRGHLLNPITWKTVSASGVTHIQTLPVSMNFIDDFSLLSAEQKANGPAIQLSNTVAGFGKLKKSGFLGLGNKRASQQITITNEGKSALTLHSAGCDDERVQVAIDRKTLQPGETVTLNVMLNPKTVKGTLETDLYVVCNDARGPVRGIRIVAEGYK
ncbi:MAG: DUF1573 domain-containing protein [Tannerella sp.]|jgi:hypothetical protein|nr:DUF1573 domain-containing protein [Tannerella sp.]